MNKVPRAVVFADDSLAIVVVVVVVVVVLFVVAWCVLATVAFATIVVEVVERQHVTAVIAAPIVVGATCADITTMCCKYPVAWAIVSWHRCPGTTVVAYNAVCVAEVVVISLVITGPRVTGTEQIVVATAD